MASPNSRYSPSLSPVTKTRGGLGRADPTDGHVANQNNACQRDPDEALADSRAFHAGECAELLAQCPADVAGRGAVESHTTAKFFAFSI